ncbi:hypothetical protein ABZ904_42225 [Streptomyces sp. NPDC046900]|uniref:hypothetical protein n=1 Tax=Streptomyces sp. NPDC046900 TaxID=3155473 RepID=UPI0033EB307D
MELNNRPAALSKSLPGSASADNPSVYCSMANLSAKVAAHGRSFRTVVVPVKRDTSVKARIMR